MGKTEKIELTSVDGEKKIELYAIEQTTVGGVSYLLAAESDEEEEPDAYILKETKEEGENVIYSFVEDQTELETVAGIFAELLEDVDIEF